MTAFVLFWSALFCAIFFILGTVFRGVASLFTGLLTSVAKIRIALVVIVGLVVLDFIYLFVHDIIYYSSDIWEIIFAVVVIGVLAFFVGPWLPIVGEIIAGIAGVVGFIISGVYIVFKKTADICDKAFAHFLMTIVKRLDKC